MTDNTQPEAGSTHIIRYALEMGLLWIDGDGRDKVREALDALDTLEAQPTPTAQADSQPAPVRGIEDCPELNMSNYGELEVSRLNDWAIRASAEIDRLSAARAPAESVPKAQFDDPKVQAVYAILCEDAEPPKGEHWEGFAARRIVDALLADSVLEDACHAPPLGWRCTRKAGHEGPCAAVEYEDDKQFVERGMQRIRDAEDAARYQWLRNFHADEIHDDLPYIAAGESYVGAWALYGVDADKAIDAARKQGDTHD